MSVYRRTLGALAPYGKHLGASVALSALHAVSSGLLVWLLGPLLTTLFRVDLSLGQARPDGTSQEAIPGGGMIDSIKQWLQESINQLVIRPNVSDTLINFCIIIVFSVLLINLFSYLQGFFMAYVQQGVMKRFRDQLFIKYQRLSLAYFHQQRTGHLISRVTNDVVVLNEAVDVAFNRLVTDSILVLLMGSFLLMISWQLTVAAAVVLPPVLYFGYYLGKTLRRYSERAQSRMADVNSVLEESINNIRIVKAFSMEQFEIEKFTRATETYFRSLLKMARVRNLASPVSDLLASFAGAIILWYAGSQILAGSGALTAGEFVTYIFAMFSLIKPVKALTQAHVRIQEGMAAAQRIYDVLDAPETVINRPAAHGIGKLAWEIVYDRVSFRYLPNEPVLQEISCRIRQGEMVAIVGPSGAGKSTLVDLLPRFYDPDAGAILLDGTDIRDLRLHDLRSLMGIVTQETYLFNDTIRNNIAYGIADLSDERLYQATEAANAHQFILQFADGYETIVGNRGVRLSGGQRQRLAIARALLKDPQILIFDEATSSLDTESEALVQEAIDRLIARRTAIVIAHRLSTVRRADQILVLDQGRIVEQGKHDDLLAHGGLYARLHALQFTSGSAEPGRVSQVAP